MAPSSLSAIVLGFTDGSITPEPHTQTEIIFQKNGSALYSLRTEATECTYPDTAPALQGRIDILLRSIRGHRQSLQTWRHSVEITPTQP